MITCLLVSCNGKDDEVAAQVYRQDGGYGYKIIYRERVLINQGAIPAIPGGKKFCDSLDAVKVSNEVLERFKNRTTPTITADDLKRLKIKLKC